jgi:hypothetical protein
MFVVPVYGTGWIRENPTPDSWGPKDIIGPQTFYLQVEAFLEFDKQLIGVRGKIVEKGHQYDGYRCLACLRFSDESNFADKPGHYMVWISRNELHFSPAAEKAVYEYVTPDRSALCLCGYAVIADSPTRVQRYVEIVEKTRKSIENDKGI